MEDTIVVQTVARHDGANHAAITQAEDIYLTHAFTETVAERLKKRQRPKATHYATPATIRVTTKRPKTAYSDPNDISQAFTSNTDISKTLSQGADVVQSVLTPPSSQDGTIDGSETAVKDEAWQPVPFANIADLPDVDFARETMMSLTSRIPRHGANVGRRQMKRIVQLLQVASPARQDEGPWLTEQSVTAYLEPGTYHDGPIFISNQQPLPLMKVEDLLSEFYDDGAGVWIQDPSMTDFSKSTREVNIGSVKQRLRSSAASEHPWNCLEMAAPLEDGSRPKFLNTEECRLLTKIKIPNPEPYFVGAKVGRRFLRHGYKEAEKWVLLAQAGALTEPHQDSHGYNTYITVNDGIMGYGWMHKPTEQERLKWIKSPHKFIEASWRYRVLRPGDTVYFPARTIHFVFRHPALGHTLAFGGHVLRCSTIVPWIQAMKDESTNPDVTNEELTTAAFGYLEQVGTFVQQALASANPSSLDRWGGRESAQTFLKLKSDLVSRR